ncbi:hypothetical protein HJG60_008340 [Phyllostomus discolor]|uniref:Uncharacterized protein n=1 Tax=Phyllostomus discolor TaxID=89673 RepID=A0A833Z9G5_9CHIR|nr:hypothetical protein HJG60_008340 [Phyllostomus discolor]
MLGPWAQGGRARGTREPLSTNNVCPPHPGLKSATRKLLLGCLDARRAQRCGYRSDRVGPDVTRGTERHSASCHQHGTRLATHQGKKKLLRPCGHHGWQQDGLSCSCQSFQNGWMTAPSTQRHAKADSPATEISLTMLRTKAFM